MSSSWRRAYGRLRTAAILKRPRRAPVGPRLRGLELRGQAKEHRLVAERRDELHAYREPLRRTVERHRHGRVAGSVEWRGEGDRAEDRVPERFDAPHRVDHAQLVRRA